MTDTVENTKPPPSLRGHLLMQLSDNAIHKVMALDETESQLTAHAFPRMLYAMVGDPEVTGLQWDPSGLSFKINVACMELKRNLALYLTDKVSGNTMIPKFLMMLGEFGFDRQADGITWSHISFSRDEPSKMVGFESLPYSTRAFDIKTHNKRAAPKPSAETPAPQVSSADLAPSLSGASVRHSPTDPSDSVPPAAKRGCLKSAPSAVGIKHTLPDGTTKDRSSMTPAERETQDLYEATEHEYQSDFRSRAQALNLPQLGDPLMQSIFNEFTSGLANAFGTAMARVEDGLTTALSGAVEEAVSGAIHATANDASHDEQNAGAPN
jgi:hypothetical protein